jgi:uncharacterized membrane protein YoaK (UPF0700 family)
MCRRFLPSRSFWLVQVLMEIDLRWSIRNERMLRGSLLLLTFVTGLVDAVSFLGLGHIFTANMMGNVVFMAFATTGVPNLSMERLAVAFSAALTGGMIARHLDTRMYWSRRNERLAFGFAVETILLTISAATSTSPMTSILGADRALFTVITATGIAMGIRHATVRRLALPAFAATGLESAVQGLALDSRLGGGADVRWFPRAASILSMFLGAVCGVLLLKYSLATPMITAAALTGGATLVQLTRGETEDEAKLRTSVS